MGVYLNDSGWSHLYRGISGWSEPLTFCCWFRPKNITETHPLVTACNNTDKTKGYAISARCDQANDPIYATEHGVPVGTGTSVKTGIVANTWQHGAGVFGSPDYRLVYLNGSAGNEHTADMADPSTLELFQIGYYEFHTAHSAEMDVAEVAVWNTTLSAAAIQNMYTNKKSALSYPTGLIAYFKLIDDYVDTTGGANLIVYGTPSFTTHPEIDYEVDDPYGPKIQII